MISDGHFFFNLERLPSCELRRPVRKISGHTTLSSMHRSDGVEDPYIEIEAPSFLVQVGNGAVVTGEVGIGCFALPAMHYEKEIKKLYYMCVCVYIYIHSLRTTSNIHTYMCTYVYMYTCTLLVVLIPLLLIFNYIYFIWLRCLATRIPVNNYKMIDYFFHFIYGDWIII